MFTPDRIKAFLGGKNLACWCHLDQPCHADVLLRIANEPQNAEVSGAGTASAGLPGYAGDNNGERK